MYVYSLRTGCEGTFSSQNILNGVVNTLNIQVVKAIARRCTKMRPKSAITVMAWSRKVIILESSNYASVNLQIGFGLPKVMYPILTAKNNETILNLVE